MASDDSLSMLSRLLDEALELPAGQRTAWVETLAPEFDPIKPRLRVLLARTAELEASDYLGTLAKFDPDASDDPAAATPARAPGDSIGPYRLLRELGAGGMGAVWLAERIDGLIERPVALKLPHQELLTAGLAERMARERKILAALNHPNIAQLYDAGVACDGQPYLALAYVDGMRIDQYCKQHGIDLPGRLHLFLQVANAVAHAHAKLVVHRDLKPANILVTPDAQVRLLDFGIAKILEEGAAQETALTRLSGRALTPDYASPEQLTGEPITIASDVYSLGVVLYELLTDKRPYKLERNTRGALEDAILEAEPSQPSTAAESKASRKALRGDLDTIILKALKKTPDERYATVNALVDDLERHLAGRPVLAQPDSGWYRLRKFVGRNKLAVGAAASVLIAIVISAALIAWQASVALAEKARAEEVKEFIASIFRDADPYEGAGDALTAVDLLRQARQRIDETFADRPDLQVELRNIVGFSLSNLEDYETADALTAQTVDLARRALGDRHALTLKARVVRLGVARFRGKTDEMRRELAELLAEARAGGDFDAQDRVSLLEYEAHLAIDEGRYADAERAADDAVDLATKTLGLMHPLTAEVIGVRALSYQYNEKPVLAAQAAEHSYRLTLDVHHGNRRHPLVNDARFVYGRALVDVGRSAEAILQIDAAIENYAALHGSDSTAVGFAANFLSRAQFDVGDIRQALHNSERSLSILSRHAQPQSFTMGAARAHYGKMLLAARRAEEASVELSASIEVLSHAIGDAHDNTDVVRANHALALGRIGRTEAAIEELSRMHASKPHLRDSLMISPAYALGVARRLSGDAPAGLTLQREALTAIESGPRARFARMRILTEIGVAEVELGNFAAGERALAEALALYEELQTHMSPAHADALLARARARIGAGDCTGALPSLEQANAFWRGLPPENRWTGEAALWLGRCYSVLGRRQDAREHLARARRILLQSPIPADKSLLQLARTD